MYNIIFCGNYLYFNKYILTSDNVLKFCFQSSLNYEKFYVISLNLPQHPQLKIELTDILEQYIKNERLENMPCTNCDKNNTETNGKSYIKSVKFGKVFNHFKILQLIQL